MLTDGCYGENTEVQQWKREATTAADNNKAANDRQEDTICFLLFTPCPVHVNGHVMCVFR